MSFIQCLLIMISVSLDGFWAGAALGVARTKLDLKQMTALGVSTFMMTLTAAIIGTFAVGFINARIITIVGAVLLGLLGLSHVKPKKENTGEFKNGIMLGIAVGADASIAAFSLATANISPLFIGLGMMITHVLFVSAANKIALSLNFDVPNKYKGVGGYLLIAMAVARIMT